MQKPIYMDHHATTPIDPCVLEAMKPFYLEKHSVREEQAAIAESRAHIAHLIGSHPHEIRFTTGATESDNLAIKGIAYANRDRGNHIITSQVEHKAVLDACSRLETEGFDITYLPVDQYGLVNPDQVKQAITNRTILVSLIHGNNEVGTINALKDIGHITRSQDVLFHTDAVQTAGKIPVNVDDLGVDLLSLSAHKLYGPKGIGALYIRDKSNPVRLTSFYSEPFDKNVPGIVGFGTACTLCENVMNEEQARLIKLRERLYHGLLGQLDDIYLNGHPTQRLPGNLNMSFAYIEGGSLLLSLRDIAVSSGSACTSRTSIDPSYVLMAMGRSETLAQSAIRFGLGRGNTEEEVDYTINTITKEAKKLRSLSVHYKMGQLSD